MKPIARTHFTSTMPARASLRNDAHVILWCMTEHDKRLITPYETLHRHPRFPLQERLDLCRFSHG